VSGLLRPNQSCEAVAHLFRPLPPRNIPSCQLSLKYDVMPYVGVVTPGVGARARNPTWTNGTKASSPKTLGEWDIAVPGIKSGGVGS